MDDLGLCVIGVAEPQLLSISPGTLASNVIDARSLGEGWLRALDLVLRTGNWTDDGEERLLESRPVMIRFASVESGDPIIGQHADRDRIQLMLLKHRSRETISDYKVSYGQLLYENNGVDQVAWVTDRLRRKPETKSASIGLHVPGEDDLSCLSLLDFKLRDRQLTMTAVYRSQNVWGSQPGNVLALREVQEQVAEGVGVLVGRLDLVALSAHIYERDVQRAQSVLRGRGRRRLILPPGLRLGRGHTSAGRAAS